MDAAVGWHPPADGYHQRQDEEDKESPPASRSSMA
jgi:hypothetical protein